MSNFYDRSREDRIGADSLAGQPAEAAFHRYMAGRGYTEGREYVRMGFDRVDTSRGLIAGCDPFIAHLPDFVQLGGHVWEVQGCGARGAVIFKREKLETLHRDYARLMSPGRQVRFFIYNSASDTALVMPLATVLTAIADPRTKQITLDGYKAAYEVPLIVFLDRLVTDCFAVEKAQAKAAKAEREQAEAAAVAATRELAQAAGVELAALPAKDAE